MGLNPDDQQLEEIIVSIPKFHVDYSPENGLMLKLAEVYQKSIQYAQSLMDEADGSLTPGGTPLLHTLPYFRIPMKEAWYTPDFAQLLIDMPFEKQIDWLNREGKYVQLSFGEERETEVYQMRLKRFFGASNETSLELLEDYFVRENKIFLLPRFIINTTQQLSHLHAFEIKLNRKTLEHIWPTPFEDDVRQYLPRYEYRNAVEAYHHLMQSDLTIRAFKRAIAQATGWDEYNVQDEHSLDLSRAKKRLYKEMHISPATFIVTIPERLTGDRIRINVAITLVDEAKQTETHYWFFVDVLRTDILETEDERRVMTRKKKLDVAQQDDGAHTFAYKYITDDLFDGMQYDLAIRYDQSQVFGGFFDGTYSWFEQKFSAVLDMIRHHFNLDVTPPDFEAISETLDFMTDFLNVRQTRHAHEEELLFEERRLKVVLQTLGETALFNLFKGLKPFKFDEAIRLLQFGRLDQVGTADSPIPQPRLIRKETLLFFVPGKPELNYTHYLDLPSRPTVVNPEEVVGGYPVGPVENEPPDPTLDTIYALDSEPETPIGEPVVGEEALRDFQFNKIFMLDADVLDDRPTTNTLDRVSFDRSDLEVPYTAELVKVIPRNFPEVPRNFTSETFNAKKRFVIRPNQDGTDRFELLSSNDQVEWVVIESIPNNPNETKIGFTHDVIASSTRYYRVRAVAGIHFSLPTMAMDKNVLPN